MDQLLLPIKALKTPSSNLSCVNENQSELESHTHYPRIEILKSDGSKEVLDVGSQGTHIDYGLAFASDLNRKEINKEFLDDNNNDNRQP